MNIQKYFNTFMVVAIAVLLIGVPMTAFAQNPETSDTDMVQFPGNGHFYQVIEMHLSWHEARDYCAGLDGHLVTISDASEDNFVYNLDPWGWLGITDELVEGDWQWVTDELLTYTHWASGEPDNCANGCAGQPPYYMEEDYAHYQSNGWHDWGDATSSFVCEWDIIHVEIDIKPGSYPNSINLGANGVVPVAVLTTDGFDAGDLDPVTVVFAGASPLRWSLQDVDWDGDMDLLFHFKTQELQLDAYSTEAWLTGATFEGMSVEGADSVNIVPPG